MRHKLLWAFALSVVCLVTAWMVTQSDTASCTGSSPTWTATPDQPSIQTCIDSATAGDTVNVSAGSATWTAPVSISSKKLTLAGAGIGNTNITDTASGGACAGAVCVLGVSTTNFVSVSGFTFIKSTSHVNGGIVYVSGTQNVVDTFRVHDNRFLVPSVGATSVLATTWGLIDNNTFDITATAGSIHAIEGYGGTTGAGDGGFPAWAASASPIGTDNALFVEQNHFNESTQLAGVEVCIDGFAGVFYVIRYNVFTNCQPGWHGTDSGSYRSALGGEVYNNTYTNNSSTTYRPATVRGGTIIAHDNTFNGSHTAWNGYTLQYFRVAPSPVVTGTDGLPYTVKLTHTSDSTNKPITGSNFATYWLLGGLSATTWATSTSYTVKNPTSTWGGCDGTNWDLTGTGVTFPGTRVSRNASGGTVGATTDSAGYSSGSTTVTLAAAGTGNIAGGDYLVFAGSNTIYVVTVGDADVSNGGTISFTPGLNITLSAAPHAISDGGFRFDDATNSLVAAKDGTHNTYLDGSGTGGSPCRDQIGRGPRQMLSPAYNWNDSGGSPAPVLGTFDAYNQTGLDSLVQSGRDYYNATPMPGYVAYTYPHPLQGGGAPPPPRRIVPGMNLKTGKLDQDLLLVHQ